MRVPAQQSATVSTVPSTGGGRLAPVFRTAPRVTTVSFSTDSGSAKCMQCILPHPPFPVAFYTCVYEGMEVLTSEG